MKHLVLVLTLLPFFTFCGKNKKESKTLQQEAVKVESINITDTPVNIADGENYTFFLMRHAEEIRTDPKNKNPILNVQGLERAKNLANFFEKTRIDTLYITKYLPTRQTATPITQQKNLKKNLFQSREIRARKIS